MVKFDIRLTHMKYNDMIHNTMELELVLKINKYIFMFCNKVIRKKFLVICLVIFFFLFIQIQQSSTIRFKKISKNVNR